MGAMKLLLIAALILSIACLVLAVFHWLHLRRDAGRQSSDLATQSPLWLEFPRAYTRQGRHHQRRFFIYFAVFLVLLLLLFIFQLV